MCKVKYVCMYFYCGQGESDGEERSILILLFSGGQLLLEFSEVSGVLGDVPFVGVKGGSLGTKPSFILFFCFIRRF